MRKGNRRAILWMARRFYVWEKHYYIIEWFVALRRVLYSDMERDCRP